MIPMLRARAASLLTLAALARTPLAGSLVACGGSERAPVPPPPTTAAPSATPQPVASIAPTRAPPPTEPAPLAPPPPAPVQTSAVATTRVDPSWSLCHQSYKAKAKDVAKDVAAMAKGCEAATKMKPVGKTLSGKQGAEDAPQTFPFDAKAGHCYRAFAQATDDIKDLDLAVKDSAGVLARPHSPAHPRPPLPQPPP